MDMIRQIMTRLSRKMLMLMALCTSIQAVADGISVHFPDVTLKTDSISEVTLTYNSDVEDIRGFQIEFFLPDGIHIADAKITNDLKRACSGLSVSFNDRRSDGKSIIMVFQIGANNFPTGELDFLKIQYQADSDVENGTYPVTTEKLLFASDSKGSVLAENQTFNIIYSDGSEVDSIEAVKWNVFDAKGNSEKQGFVRQGNRILIPGILSADMVHVYSMDGVALAATFTECETGLALSLDQLPRGVYIVDVNGKRTKIARP